MDGRVLFDPRHGGCLRVIRRNSGTSYRIDGVYGNDEAPHLPGTPWLATFDVIEQSETEWKIVVDFEKKDGAPRKLRATYKPARRLIRWEDGNTWRVMFVARRQVQILMGQHRRRIGA